MSRLHLGGQPVKKAKITRRARRPSTAAPVFAAPAAPDLSAIRFASSRPASPEPKLSRRALKKLNANAVKTYEQFTAALASEAAQITLGEDIIIEKSLVIDHDVAINFNGHNLISPQTLHDFRLLDIHRGEVTLTGAGKIFALGVGSVAIRVFGAISASLPHYTTLTVDERVELFAPEGSGILISANLGAAYGVTVNFSGSITARSGICLGQGVRGTDGNFPIINVKSGSTIVADDTCAAAIEAGGLGIWRIGAAKLYGLSGLWLKLGTATLEHTHIFSAGTSLELADLPGANVCLRIRDGIYLSANREVISGNVAGIAELSLENGEFCGAKGVLAPGLSELAKITGGNYGSDIAAIWSEYAPDLPFPILEEESPAPLNFTPEPEPNETIIIPDLPAESAPISELEPELEPEPTFEPAPKPAPKVYPPLKTSLEVIASPITLNVAESPIPFAPEPSNPTPAPSFAPTPTPVEEPIVAEPIPPEELPLSEAPSSIDERAALIETFSEALRGMDSLKSSDYDSGFTKFKTVLANTELLLTDPEVDFDEISTAASELLAAFDQLHKREDLSLTDEELDRLFYDGAVLQEFAESAEALPAETTSSNLPAVISSADVDFANDDFEEDYFQDEFISDEASEEEADVPFVGPAGDPGFLAEAASLIDESAPALQWTTGAASIDELAPVIYEGPAFRLHHHIASSFLNFYQSVSAGFHAGLAAFHNSRQDFRA